MAEYVSSNPMAVIQPLEFPGLHNFIRATNGSTPAEASLLSEPVIRYSHPEPVPPPQTSSKRYPLRDAIQRARHIEPDSLTQLLHADMYLYHNRTREAIPHLERGLLGCRQLPELQGLIWMQLGMAHMDDGHFHKASVCYLHHLAFCRELGDYAGITKAECYLGIAYTKLGLFKLAGRCFQQYLENSQRLQDQKGISGALSNLGLLSKTIGLQCYREAVRNKTDKSQARKALNEHLQRAVTYLEQHLVIVEELEDLEKQARAYGNLGWCYQTMKQYPQALFCHKKHLEICRTTGDRLTESCTLCNLGNCLRATGKLEEAIDHYTLNLELSRAIGYKHGEIVSLLNLGTTCEQLEQLDKAIEWHTLHLSAVVEKEDLHGQARALSTLAGIYEETQQMTKAEDYYRKLSAVFCQLGKRESQHMASQFAKRMKLGTRKEKQLSATESRKTFKKYKFSPRRKIRTVSSPNTSRLPAPKRKLAAAPTARKPPSSQEGDEVLANSLAEEVQCIPHDQEQPIPQLQQHPTPHREHAEQLVHKTKSCTPDDQREETIITRPLPESPPPSDVESLTSFESIGGFQCNKNIVGSRHHVEEPKREGAALSQSVSELGLEGTDKEWGQWVYLQEGTDSTLNSQLESLNIDVNPFFTKGSPSSLSGSQCLVHHGSAPYTLDSTNQVVETVVELHIQ